jgi:hypothetical protein
LGSFIFQPFVISEKVIATLFFIQEMVLSGSQIHYTRKILKVGEAFQKQSFRGAMVHFIDANLLPIGLDIIYLSLNILPYGECGAASNLSSTAQS